MTRSLQSAKRVLTLSAIAFTLPVAAQESGQTASDDAPYPSFAEVDRNDDEKVTWKEAKAAGIPKEEFQGADFDNDGELTRIGYRYTLNRSG